MRLAVWQRHETGVGTARGRVEERMSGGCYAFVQWRCTCMKGELDHVATVTCRGDRRKAERTVITVRCLRSESGWSTASAVVWNGSAVMQWRADSEKGTGTGVCMRRER